MEFNGSDGRYQIGGTSFDLNKETVIMGILNVTPDSFSDGGRHGGVGDAVRHARKMRDEGAKIIDVGGESTRPGHQVISVDEELSRIVPVIERLKDEEGMCLSVDTYKAEVAKGALDAGAHIINDIWGARREPAIAGLAAERGVPIILMHNREKAEYGDFWPEAKADLEESLRITKRAGVEDGQIWLDPGIGFGKTTHHNILMMQHLGDLVEMGYPVLLATSRKRLIGNVLGLPVDERLEGTGATVCYGIQKGCGMVRVHDVKEIARMARMMDVLTGRMEYEGE
ncbi:dihydropteroate synthase [Edaphobacillus lindanitolerans]|uniref:Dihydropteroate synthase n=1 Tax=Edaphobacillus lindanitolerans TaxID=550447 RepID=A0A1U7PRF1_9BACI|nr:dihydropteroate synthase [Edaphobacillus lindanitolerans]SIT93322.1 Dihydropteroate synthase [Edaphobacillus lindanitolerans]